MTGKVYFVSAPGRIKIGYTAKPEARLVQLQSKDMEKLTMIGIIAGDRQTERFLHNRLDDYRLRGEWFTDCLTVRQVVNAAIAGKIHLPKAVVRRRKAFAVEEACPKEVEILRGVVAESLRLGDSIMASLRAGQRPSPDKLQALIFLGESVVVPMIAPEIARGR